MLPAIFSPQMGQTVAVSLIWCPHSGHLIIAIVALAVRFDAQELYHPNTG